jgi:hypothetical protein
MKALRSGFSEVPFVSPVFGADALVTLAPPVERMPCLVQARLRPHARHADFVRRFRREIFRPMRCGAPKACGTPP